MSQPAIALSENLEKPSVENGGNRVTTREPPPLSARERKRSDVYTTSNGVVQPATRNADPSTEDEEDEVYKAKEKLRNRSPLRYCKWITDRPKLSFGMALGAHILMFIILMVLFRSGYDIFPFTVDRLPLEIRENDDYLRGLAWINRNDDSDIITRGTQSNQNETERTMRSDIFEMHFELPGGNVFTKENLLKMKEVEDEFFSIDTFQKEHCLLDSSSNCTKSTSILRYFDGTFKQINPVFDDPNFDNIIAVLYEASINVRTSKLLQYHLGKDAVINNTIATSEITRAMLPLGGPLAGYANKTDREDEQKDIRETFMVNEFGVLADLYFKEGVGEMDFFYFSGALISNAILKQVILDMMLAVGSLCFIFLFMWIQTGSLWVTGLAVFSITACFVTSNLIYRIALDFRYIGIFHVLALFIILGIGADDIFIFFDTWKESSHHKYPSLAHRLSDCYRKASLAMFYTSLTTAIAFIVSATSPFLGIYSFGVFAGVLVVVNYISVIIFFPTVIVTYHLYWEKYKCCCCCNRDNTSVTDLTPTHSEQRKNPIVRFFRGPYFNFVTHKIFRWVIIVCFAAILGVFIYFVTKLKVNEEQVKFLKDDTNFGKYLLKRDVAFKSSSARGGTEIYLVWGLKKQSLENCHHTDDKCTGTTVWDTDFNITSLENQQALLNLCDTLKNLSKSEIDKLQVQTDIITKLPQVSCFMPDMKQFYQEEQDRVNPYLPRAIARWYPNNTQLNVPITKDTVQTIMTNSPHIYNSSSIKDDFNSYFEVAVSYWLYNGFRPGQAMGDQFRVYNPMLGESTVPGHTITKTLPGNLAYTYGTRLRYAAISINTTIVASTLGYPKGLPIRVEWENFLSEQLKSMPVSMQGGFQTALFRPNLILWHWLKVQQQLVWTGLLGIFIGVGLAFPILIIATMNIIVGFLATLIIVCVIVCVVGVIPIAGWKLGVLESLNMVLVVGLAVDYVVHLAEGYSRSSHVDRRGRTRDALEEVGISVLSGAITTLGASLFLLFAQILFFTEFGVFMFCTIGFSILFALILFITLMGLLGPQGTTGDIRPLFAMCKSKCCR